MSERWICMNALEWSIGIEYGGLVVHQPWEGDAEMSADVRVAEDAV